MQEGELHPDALLLVSDAARVLRVSTERVRQLERNGILLGTKTVSGVRLFVGAEVQRLKDAREAQTATACAAR